MPFRFSLQAVLRFRESFERRERLRLEAITREVSKAQQELEQAKLDRAQAVIQWQNRVRQGVAAGEMHFELACDRSRLRRIAGWNEQVAKLEDLRQGQIEIYRKAQQQRKILENLRNRQLAAHQIVQARRQQQELDDRFLLTHAGKSPQM